MTAVAVDTPSRKIAWSFYSWIALASVLTAFLGFVPTYWMPMAQGAFKANPIVHLHGMLFFSWTLFALVQTSLIPAGNVALHRSVGLAGISFATVLTMVGLLAAQNSLHTAYAHNQAAGGEAFLIVPLAVIATFATFFTLAIANIRRPDFHKRYMLLATISVLNAPLARPLIAWVFKLPPTEQLPVWINVPACYLSYLLVAAAMIYDWRTRGRPHIVYLVALPVLLVFAWIVIPISETSQWHDFARFYYALAGSTPAAQG
jgi:hypothetical protein